MKGRRQIIFAIGAAPWIATQAFSATPTTLGALDPFPGKSPDAGLRRWMRKFGYPEAETQKIIVAASEGRDELLPKLAIELVALQPTVILTWGDVAARAAQAATKSIPIVVMTDDLVSVAPIDILASRNRNITGVSIQATELDAKRLELLAPLVPSGSTILLLADAVTSPRSRPGLRRTAQSLGLRLTEDTVRTLEDTQQAIRSARKRGIAGVNVLASALLFQWQDEIIGLVNSERLPAIFEWSFYTDAGALMGYGPLLDSLYRRLLDQVMGLLHGGRVADFPVEQPTRFELAINLKTAAAIGVQIPPSLIVRADRVIR